MSSSECFAHTRTLQIAWAPDHLTAVTPAAALLAKIVTVGPAEPEKPGGFFSSSFISVTFITYFITEPPQHPKTKTGGRSSTVEPVHLLTAPFQHKPKQEWGGPFIGSVSLSHHPFLWREQVITTGYQLLPPIMAMSGQPHSVDKNPVLGVMTTEFQPGPHLVSHVWPCCFRLSGCQFFLCKAS